MVMGLCGKIWQQYTRRTETVLLVSLVMANTKPYVAAALVCERVLHEADNVVSAIRIVDTYTRKLQRLTSTKPHDVATPGPEVIAVMDQPFDMTALIIVKAGDVTGEHKLTLNVRNPNEKVTNVPNVLNVNFEKNDPAESAILKARFMMPSETQSGLYWIDVVWDGEVLTSIPLKIVQVVAEAGQADG
jgi:hypothetical protein